MDDNNPKIVRSFHQLTGRPQLFCFLFCFLKHVDWIGVTLILHGHNFETADRRKMT